MKIEIKKPFRKQFFGREGYDPETGVYTIDDKRGGELVHVGYAVEVKDGKSAAQPAEPETDTFGKRNRG